MELNETDNWPQVGHTPELLPDPDWAELSPYNVADNDCADVLRQVQLEQAGRRTAIALLRGLKKRTRVQQQELDDLVLLVAATDAGLAAAVNYD